MANTLRVNFSKDQAIPFIAIRARLHLTATEVDCIDRYVAFAIDRLAGNLVEVWLFGSAARGDMWPAHSPMRSDVDLLIVTRVPVDPTLIDELVNATYPLFLEAGRQISPQFWTAERFAAPDSDRARSVAERVRAEGLVLYRVATPSSP
ncbi:MAG: nucleotidyltransferase domain-containing protein [bacterium]